MKVLASTEIGRTWVVLRELYEPTIGGNIWQVACTAYVIAKPLSFMTFHEARAEYVFQVETAVKKLRRSEKIGVERYGNHDH